MTQEVVNVIIDHLVTRPDDLSSIAVIFDNEAAANNLQQEIVDVLTGMNQTVVLDQAKRVISTGLSATIKYINRIFFIMPTANGDNLRGLRFTLVCDITANGVSPDIKSILDAATEV